MPERMIFRIVLVSLLLLIPLGIYFVPEVMAVVFTFISAVTPIWLPLILSAVFAPLWILYVRSQYVASIPYVVLELTPGPATPKSARAAEFIFYSLYHRTDISRFATIIKGQVRLPWSFEVAVIDGSARFFMRIPKDHRQAIESRFRAEYHDIDLTEGRDYAREIGFNPFTMRLQMREYELAKADPYPLLTYEAHEAKEPPYDPVLKLLESFVKMKQDEYLYLSWLVRPHQRERKHLWEEPTDTLYTDARAAIAALVGSSGNLKAIPESKQKLVADIEAGLKKPTFDVGLRALYMADRKVWSDERATSLDTMCDVFSDHELNGFIAVDPGERIAWPLTDVIKAVPWVRPDYFLNLYRRRAFFAPPYYGKAFILNTAELATVFHMPVVGRVSPLGRARGERLEPPDNLPVAA